LEELRESVASYPIVLRGKDRAESAKQGMKCRRVRKTNQSVHTNRKKQQKDQEQVSTMGLRQLLTKKSQNKDTNRAVHITISIGVADNRQKKSRVALVIKEADKALYRAKEGGRNKVSV
jgi:GGDEF domain-containing protein